MYSVALTLTLSKLALEVPHAAPAVMKEEGVLGGDSYAYCFDPERLQLEMVFAFCDDYGIKYTYYDGVCDSD